MDKISSWFEDSISFKSFLVWAEGNVETDLDKEFIADLRQRWTDKGMDAQLSELQAEMLYRLSATGQHPARVEEQPFMADATDPDPADDLQCSAPPPPLA